MRSGVEILLNIPEFKKDPMYMKTKMYQEFLIHFDKILNELKIPHEYFNTMGATLGLKNTFDFAMFFGSFDSIYEIYDKGSGCNIVLNLDIERTKENISFMYENYKFYL